MRATKQIIAVAFALTVWVCFSGSSAYAAEKASRVKVQMWGLRIVSNAKVQDKRLGEVLPWLRRHFSKKGFVYESKTAGILRSDDNLTMRTPDGKTLKLTVEKVKEKSFVLRLEAMWTEKNKKKRWQGIRQTVTQKEHTTLANVPVVRVDEGLYAVVIRSELSD